MTFTSPDGSQSASATVYITNSPGLFTYHNDNLRTGQNLNETVLTPANVTPATFGRLYAYPLDGFVYAAPLYVANLNIPNQGFHNVVYVATEHDSVYAFDADGLSSGPLWRVSFINPPGVTTVPEADMGTSGSEEVGITGTPVIDQATGTLYLVAKTKETIAGTTTYVHRLHALDLTSGAEKLGGPVVIQTSVPGTGDGGSQVSFGPLHQHQRAGLLLLNGIVYVGFASWGDVGTWHGWVLGFDATTLRLVVSYNATPNGSAGGIWQGGGGLAADSSGDIYFATGNGTFDANLGGPDYGDSIERISPSGAVADSFTPHDQQSMNDQDLDLGSGGPLLLPDQSGPYPHLLVMAGKSGTIYLVNRDNMGRYNPNNDNQIPEALANAFFGDQNFKPPVYFGGTVYFGAVNDLIRAFQVNGGSLVASTPSLSRYAYPGAAMAISANGNTDGILWAVEKPGVTVPGVLHAYDATNLGTELYNSSQAGSRDTLDSVASFTPPTVVNGKVFVASVSQLAVYGLLPGTVGSPSSTGFAAQVSQDGSDTLQTGVFSTTTNSDLLVAFVAYDGPTTAPQTATVSGAGVPWQLVTRSNAQFGTAEIWVARATSVLTSVTVTSQPGVPGYHGSLTVIVATNASGAGMVGQASAQSGAPDISLPAVTPGNWVFAVGNDWDQAIVRTPVSGQVLVHQDIDTAVGDTFWVQRTAAPSTATALVDIHDSAPTADRWNYAAIEIASPLSDQGDWILDTSTNLEWLKFNQTQGYSYNQVISSYLMVQGWTYASVDQICTLTTDPQGCTASPGTPYAPNGGAAALLTSGSAALQGITGFSNSVGSHSAGSFVTQVNGPTLLTPSSSIVSDDVSQPGVASFLVRPRPAVVGCGIGPELTIAAPLLLWLRSRRRRVAP